MAQNAAAGQVADAVQMPAAGGARAAVALPPNFHIDTRPEKDTLVSMGGKA